VVARVPIGIKEERQLDFVLVCMPVLEMPLQHNMSFAMCRMGPADVIARVLIGLERNGSWVLWCEPWEG